MKLSGRSTGTRRTLKANNSRYEIVCVNFYDKGLNAVRDEFMKRVKAGSRRSIFIIDLAREIEEAQEYNILNSRLSKPKVPLMKAVEKIQIVQNNVATFLQQNDFITKKIQEEKSFNMYSYWLKNMDTQIFKTRTPLKKEKPETKRASKKGSRKFDNLTGAGGDTVSLDIVCYGLAPKPHTKVGRGELYSKRLYIEDEPLDSSLTILIIGEMNNEFYIELLKINQPLRAIIHFMPEECAYDILVPRPKREKFLQDTLESIHKSIYSIRKRNITKETGIFQQKLPVMSVCSASRYSDDIFNQLSWYFYDVGTIYRWYLEYYVRRYVEWNVQLSFAVNLNDSREMAESLNIQGHYLKSAIPAAIADNTTIYMYMEGLLSTFDQPRELLTPTEVLLLANPNPLTPIRTLDKMRLYTHVFQSTFKLPKSERLFIEESNKLLFNLLSYEEQTPLLNLYYACLEYNILRRYFASGYTIISIPQKPYTGDLEPIYLHKYAKVYLTDDSETQRLVELIDEYPDYKVEQAQSNVKLFTFRRVLNEVFERENEIVIPSRLCYRDFTLYEMEQFFKDFVTPETYIKAVRDFEEANAIKSVSATTLQQVQSHNRNSEIKMRLKDGQEIKFSAGTFIRPKSLKSTHMNDLNLNDPSACLKERNASIKTVGEPTRRSTRKIEGTEDVKQQTDIVPGLPTNHPMLKGYNLGDTRQTIKTKTTSYNYEEGKLELFEELWNFVHTNATLSLLVNKFQFHLSCPLHDTSCTSSNYRLSTPIGLNLRVSLEDKECSKIVLNYPNGLSIYTHEQHVEQLWKPDKPYNDEIRRIYTPFGAVIVFYTSDDMVLIMRYNGEVYKLYNYLEEAEEEGEDLSGFGSQLSNTSTGLQTVEHTIQQESKKRPSAGKRRSKGGANNSKKRSKGGANDSKKASVLNGNESKKPSTLNAVTQKKISIESLDSTIKAAAKRKPQKNHARASPKQLLASIENEMKYLNYLKILYELSYLHLKVTTSCGHVVHVITTGKVYEGRKEKSSDWHDYWANEEYFSRSDGLKMIWTADSLKCYHADGTVITTKSIESIETSVDDEFDLEVSESSSHENVQEESTDNLQSMISVTRTSQNSVKENEVPVVDKNKPKISTKSTIFDHLCSEEGEEPYIFDPTFIAYMPSGYCMQHLMYAGVRILLTLIGNYMYVTIELCAADDLYIKICHEPELGGLSEEEEEVPAHEHVNDSNIESDSEENTEISSLADSDEYTRHKHSINKEYSEASEELIIIPLKTVIDIKWKDVAIASTKTALDLDMLIRRFGCSENVCEIREVVSLKLDYKESVSKIFRKWVRDIARFIRCGCPKSKTFYFVELTLDDCKKRGFELLAKLPNLREYNFCASNVVLDIGPLEPIEKLLENHFQWYEDDMKKFPRFKNYLERNKVVEVEVPMVMGTNLFVEVPRQLDTTDRIHQFTDPFDRITFRKLRYRLNEAVLFHLHPNLRLLLQQLISKKSWQQHLIQYRRQLFIEQQRLGLYMAMLKHKVYPNYFMFYDKFYGHVRNIDFFEFMTMKCNEKNNPKLYEEDENIEANTKRPKTAEERRLERLKRKKCLCPKYL